MSLPSRYNGDGAREHIHLRLTPNMYRKLAARAHPNKSVPHLIREILEEWLEGNRQISNGTSREKEG